jgi:hypothetical protein
VVSTFPGPSGRPLRKDAGSGSPGFGKGGLQKAPKRTSGRARLLEAAFPHFWNTFSGTLTQILGENGYCCAPWLKR